MKARAYIGCAIVVLLFVTCASRPAAAQGVGAISGTITDASRAVLPGASVTLANPGTIGGNQETVTDARGFYQFTRLVPGRYSVKAEMSGLRPATRENVAVNAATTARVDLTLEVGGFEEGLVVTGEAPLLDTTTALDQTVMSRELLDALPNRIDVWSVARVVPGVVLAKYDVGGSESFLRSASSVHGSAEDENGWFIDGMDTAYTGGTGGIPIVYFDPYMFQEANYQTANGPAERSEGGIIYSMVTKTGTNAFHAMASFTGANNSMGSDNVSPELRSQLLAAVPAKVLAVNPDIVPGADIQDMFDVGVSAGGPIVRDKLWYTASTKYSYLNQFRLGSYEPSGAQVLDDNRIRNLAFKLSYQASQNNQITYLYDWHNKLIGHRTGSTDYFESKALQLNDKYMDIHQAKWTSTLSSKMFMDVGVSLMQGTDPFHPEPGVKPGDIPRFDAVTRVHTVANVSYWDRPGYRGVFNVNLSRYTGSHDLKFGYQYNRAYFGQRQGGELADFQPGIQSVFRNGVADSVNTYTTPSGYDQYAVEHALFVQDKWTPTRRLTLNLGVRFETIFAWEPAACRVQTVFVAEQCFPAIEGEPDWKNVTPRFGAVYDLSGDGTTALKFSANRYSNAVGVSQVNRLNPIQIVNDTRAWSDLNGDQLPQLNELGPSTGYPVGATHRFSPTLRRPYTNEFTLEFEQQLPAGTVVSLGYYYRATRANIALYNLAVPTSSYIPLQVTEVASGRPVTVYNQDPALRGKFDNYWDNSPESDTDFNGVDVTFRKRLSNHWSMMSSLSLGKNLGRIYSTSNDLNNPNYTFPRGVIGNDVPVSFKVSGMYELPYGISVSASSQYFSGFPENTTVRVDSKTVKLTQVNQTLVVEERGTTRVPGVAAGDVSVRKTFRLRRLSVEPEMGIFNITNAAPILARITQLGPTYGRVGSIMRGRLIKLGMNINY